MVRVHEFQSEKIVMLVLVQLFAMSFSVRRAKNGRSTHLEYFFFLNTIGMYKVSNRHLKAKN